MLSWWKDTSRQSGHANNKVLVEKVEKETMLVALLKYQLTQIYRYKIFFCQNIKANMLAGRVANSSFIFI